MRLSKKEIKYLAASFQQATYLSLFNNVDAQLDGSEVKSLTDKGIVGSNGIDPKAFEMLTILSKAQKSARLVIQNPFFMVEKYTYRFGDKLILAENYEGELELSYLEDLGELSIKLSDIFGLSSIVNTEISEVFSPDEMVVLYTLIDLVRIVELKRYSGDEVTSKAFSADEIYDQLNSGYVNGFAQIFISNYNYEIPDKEKLSDILNSLVEKGAVKNEDGFVLVGEYNRFANNYLIIESVVLYESFEIQSDDEVAAAAKLALSSGIHDLVAMYYDGDVVAFDTISAKQLLYNIEDFMKCEGFEVEVKPAEAAPAPVQQQPVQQNKNWFCPKCGQKNDGKFCIACGTPRP